MVALYDGAERPLARVFRAKRPRAVLCDVSDADWVGGCVVLASTGAHNNKYITGVKNRDSRPCATSLPYACCLSNTHEFTQNLKPVTARLAVT